PHALGPRITDVDAVAENGAVHADVAVALPLEVGADELVGGPRQDLQKDAARPKLAAPLADDIHQYLVPGRGVQGIVGADGDVGAGLAIDDLRPHETHPGRSAAIHADNAPVRGGGANDVILAELNLTLAD